jgi:tetratricopeptide (TPR) repeat protein
MKRISTPFKILSVLGIAILAMQFLLPLITGSGRGPIDTEIFDRAEASYAAGIAMRSERPDEARTKFLESASQFESLLATSDAAGLHFNRANALLEAGRTSEAIAAYLSAERRLRGDSSIEANLAEARSRVVRVTDRPEPDMLERAQRLWSPIGSSVRTIAAALLLWGAALGVMLGLRRAVVPLAAFGIALATTCAVDALSAGKSSSAVVAREAVLRKGNGEGFEPVLAEPLPAGTECRVIETRPGWIEVRCSAKVAGWLREDAVLQVR